MLRVKKARSDKKHSSVSGASTISDGPQGTPPLKVILPQDTDDVFAESSNVTNSITLDATKKAAGALRAVEGKKAEGATVNTSPGVESGVEHLLSSSRSLLDLLADQALAPEQPLGVSQELLTATVAKYKQLQLQPVQLFNFKVDTESPPLPPPCPQSGPVSGDPAHTVCQVVLPQLLRPGGFTRQVDPDEVQIISDDDDDDDVTIE